MKRQGHLRIAISLCLPVLLFVGISNARNSQRDYRLLDAAQSGDINGVRYWLAQGANPNFHNDRLPVGTAVVVVVPDGNTPLLVARNASIVRLLLDAGADVRLSNRRGETPILYLAGRGDDPELLREFIRHGALKRNTPDAVFLTAVACGRPKMVRSLLDLGAHVNACFPSGASALHHVIDRLRFSSDQTNGEETALLLLSRGALINAVDDKGATPLQLARKYKMTKLVKAMEARAKSQKTTWPKH